MGRSLRVACVGTVTILGDGGGGGGGVRGQGEGKYLGGSLTVTYVVLLPARGRGEGASICLIPRNYEPATESAKENTMTTHLSARNLGVSVPYFLPSSSNPWLLLPGTKPRVGICTDLHRHSPGLEEEAEAAAPPTGATTVFCGGGIGKVSFTSRGRMLTRLNESGGGGKRKKERGPGWACLARAVRLPSLAALKLCIRATRRTSDLASQ